MIKDGRRDQENRGAIKKNEDVLLKQKGRDIKSEYRCRMWRRNGGRYAEVQGNSGKKLGLEGDAG